jgi:MFS transporter, AAHS family, 4-hydroxybenzoate transporter
MKNFSVSEVIDSFGVNKFTWRIFFFLGLAMVFDGYDYMVVSYTMPQIKAEWALSAVQTGSLSSWSLFGLVIGGTISGILSDKLGRKRVLSLAVALYALLTLPIFFAPSFFVFALFRVLAGVGLGACIPVVTTVFSESTPTSRRGLFITFGMAWMIVGWVLAGVLSTIIVPALGWRYCYLIGGIPLIYAIFLYFKMPESAHWFANKGRKEEALKALERIEMVATGKVTNRDANLLVVPPRCKVVGPKALFSKNYISATAGIWITYFCGCFIVYGVNAWLPSMMLEKGFTLSSAYALAIAQNAAAIIANTSTGFVSDTIGRKKNLTFGYILSMVAIVLAALVSGSYGAILAVMIFMGFAINYCITAIQPLMAESYPTEFRNTGVSWAQAFGRLGGALAPIVAGIVIGMGLGYANSFLFYLIPAFIGLLATVFLVKRETRGKSLDQLAVEEECATPAVATSL